MSWCQQAGRKSPGQKHKATSLLPWRKGTVKCISVEGGHPVSSGGRLIPMPMSSSTSDFQGKCPCARALWPEKSERWYTASVSSPGEIWFGISQMTRNMRKTQRLCMGSHQPEAEKKCGFSRSQLLPVSQSCCPLQGSNPIFQSSYPSQILANSVLRKLATSVAYFLGVKMEIRLWSHIYDTLWHWLWMYIKLQRMSYQKRSLYSFLSMDPKGI